MVDTSQPGGASPARIGRARTDTMFFSGDFNLLQAAQSGVLTPENQALGRFPITVLCLFTECRSSKKLGKTDARHFRFDFLG
jgi:hypothetical protein